MTPPTYTLVGAGGTGSILLPLMIRYLESWHRNQKTEKYYVQVIDGDNIEDSNFDRQMFAPEQTGHNKAEALVQLLPDLTIGRIFAKGVYLGPGNVNELIHENDLILITVDNFSARALIEKRVKDLKNATVINGGNEMTNGSLQYWLRKGGKNITPPLSHWHDEITYKGDNDRAIMSCQAIAKLPGGEQTIAANSFSASLMLRWLTLHHEPPKELVGHEVYFDLQTMKMRPQDLRETDGWN